MSRHKPDSAATVSLTIDGLPVTVPEGTTILEAARKVNVHIPVLCDHPGLGRRAVCRLCVVECDGRGKLLAACVNNVWEGVNVVTGSSRILAIRRTIIELLLAGHPQECLTCVRSGKCELQRLAAQFGIREQVFQHDVPVRRLPLEDGEVLVRDMDKCVKCGRCVAVCQEIQGIGAISTARRGIRYEIGAPYGQALSEGPCVFCGQCAAVCPVGAIYEYDHTAIVSAALAASRRLDGSRPGSSRHTAVQIAPQAAAAIDAEFGFPAGTVTAGRLAGILRRLGFDAVFDAGVFAAQAARHMADELCERKKNSGRSEKPQLPLISACSPASVNFVKTCFPDLVGRLSACNTTRSIFRDAAMKRVDADQAAVTTVSVVPCIAHKYEAGKSGAPDIALTVRELVRMIKLAGIDCKTLPESSFDPVPGLSPAAETGVPNGMAAVAVRGLANAREVMHSIRRGECTADLVEIMCCDCVGGCGLYSQLTG